MNLTIAGIGTSLPPFQIRQDDACAIAAPLCCVDDQQTRRLKLFFDRCGVETRGSVLLDTKAGPIEGRQSFFETPDLDTNGGLGPTTAERMSRYATHSIELAEQASAAALSDSEVATDDITHLVTVSCSGFNAPGVDISLIHNLGLPPTTQRTHVGFMGCHGALNGLRVAGAFVKADPGARVLLCAVELCSLHFQYGFSPERIVANALFADGSAALVVENSSAESGRLRLLGSGSCLLPDSTDAMSWRIGDHGFEMTLSRQVPLLIEQHLRPWMESWLLSLGYTMESIGTWAVHPGGPKILDAVESALRLPVHCLEESRKVLLDHGNMSSPTILFILERLLAKEAKRPLVAMGFGPGLVVEAALFV